MGLRRWGAWLAHFSSEVGRMVVCPKKWSGSSQSSIVPAGWQLLDVPHPSTTNSASSEIAAVLLSDNQKVKAAADMEKRKLQHLYSSFCHNGLKYLFPEKLYSKIMKQNAEATGLCCC